MAKTYKPKRFTDIGLLKRLDFPLLIKLLERYSTFFEAQEGFAWAHDPAEFPFDALAEIMMKLDTAVPSKLLETLYNIEMLSNEDYYEPLLQLAISQNIRLRADSDMTVEDLALRLSLECPEELEKFHTKLHYSNAKHRAKWFQSYFVAGNIRPMYGPTEDLVQSVEMELDHWARVHRQGLGMHVFISRDHGAIWFLIRHGESIKRENAVTEDGGNEQVFFHPERYDVAIYYPGSGELAVKASTKGLKNIYIQTIGHYFFGDSAYFRIDDCCKYTLQPLIDRDADALVCLWDDTGLQNVALHELQINHHDASRVLETLHGRNVFEFLKKKKRNLASDEHITIRRAKLKVLRADGREHTLIIEPPHIAFYDRDSDHDMIHPWLVKRGFVINKTFSSGERYHVGELDEVLATS